MKILIVAAHPSAEVLGCAGTVSKLIGQGAEAYTLILGEGASPAAQGDGSIKNEAALKTLQQNIFEASKVVGVKRVFEYNFPAGLFDTVPLFEIAKVIAEVKKNVGPDLVLTHYEKDFHVDYRITYQSVMTAMRPVSDDSLKEIYSFEMPGSIEFSPNLFFDIAETMKTKRAACGKYQSETQHFSPASSSEGIETNAKMWGMKMGVSYAEAFQVVRAIR